MRVFVRVFMRRYLRVRPCVNAGAKVCMYVCMCVRRYTCVYVHHESEPMVGPRFVINFYGEEKNASLDSGLRHLLTPGPLVLGGHARCAR